ncbi:30895_t:CDS:2, partial [Racocetra persica]
GLKEELQEEFSLNRGPSLFGRRPVGTYLAEPLNRLERGQELAQSAHVLQKTSRDYTDLIAASKDALEKKNKEVENKAQEIEGIKKDAEKKIEQKTKEFQTAYNKENKDCIINETTNQKKQLEREKGELVVVHARKVRSLEEEKQSIQEEKEKFREENLNHERKIKNLTEQSITLTNQLSSTQQNL